MRELFPPSQYNIHYESYLRFWHEDENASFIEAFLNYYGIWFDHTLSQVPLESHYALRK